MNVNIMSQLWLSRHVQGNYIRRLAVLTMLCMIGGYSLLAQETVSGHVYDSSTGNPLPFAKVVAGNGTIVWSNEEGAFSLSSSSTESLVLSCHGYENQVARADETERILMTPLHVADKDTQAGVLLAEDILHRVAQQMQEDIRKHKKASAEYFIRQDNEVEGNVHLIEGMLSARSAVCLAKTRMLAGNHYSAGDNTQPFKNSNLHYTLSLGPVARRGDLWNNLSLPLMKSKPHGGHFLFETDYHLDCSLLSSRDGRQRVYRIHMTHNPRTPSLRFVHGTLLVDAETLRPLCFDGETEGLEMKLHSHIGWRNAPMAIRMHVEYTCANGFLEVESMKTWCRCEDIVCNTTIARNADGKAMERLFPDDRENMMSRHVFAREQESETLSMPILRTEIQNALVRDGIKGNVVKTYTRY